MLAKLFLLGCLLGVTFQSVTASDKDNPEITIPEITQDARFNPLVSERVAQSVMNFAHKLAVALDADNRFPNTQIFSPLSVMSSLALLQMGSNGNSYNQLNQIFDTLHRKNEQRSAKIHEEFGWLLEDVVSNSANKRRPRMETEWRSTPFNPLYLGTGGSKTPSDHIVRVSSAIFVQNGFSLKPDYAYAAQSVYKSEVTPLDFQNDERGSRDYINSWVNQNTLGRIPTIIDDSLNNDINMILASTIYFKGFWEQPFLGSGTAKANFFPDGPMSEPTKVMMMGLGGVFPFYDAREFNCRIIGLPYKGNQSTMYVILPNNSTRLNLQQLQRTLTGEDINAMISKMEYKTAVIAFPKFHIRNTLNLKSSLIRMGIEDIFKNTLADFSLIADPEKNSRERLASVPPLSGFPGAQVVPVPQNQQNLVLNFAEVMPAAATPSLSVQKSSKDLNPKWNPSDRFGDQPLIFSRFGGDSAENGTITQRPGQLDTMQWSHQGDLIMGTVVNSNNRYKRAVTYKVESEYSQGSLPLRLKDLILNKRITKTNPGKKLIRSRREIVPESAQSLQRLDQMRATPGLKKPQLFVDDILHKVDFNVNEQGSEAAAATLSYLRRSGTDVAFRCDVPFIVLIRHDPTKLPLFYGLVNIPASN